jgi:hypothetical protein
MTGRAREVPTTTDGRKGARGAPTTIWLAPVTTGRAGMTDAGGDRAPVMTGREGERDVHACDDRLSGSRD